jgi:hypothetical protein
VNRRNGEACRCSASRLDFGARVPSIGTRIVSKRFQFPSTALLRTGGPILLRARRARLLLVLLAAAMAVAAETPVQHARYLFDQRHLTPGFTAWAWQILADYRPTAPLDTAALALWCQVNVEMGDDNELKAVQERYYRIAEAAADTLRTTYPNNAAGHFWWTAAHGDRALAQGIPEALLALPAVIHELERAITSDPGFPLPYAVLGILYREIPAVAGGDWSRSRRYFEAGLRQAPNLTLLRLELARLDIRERLYGQARDQLDLLVGTQHPYFEAAFVLNDRPGAESLLAQIRGK